MKARVRLKGILKGILEQSTIETIPLPLFGFLANLVKPGQFVPDGFLSPFEIAHLNLDSYGALLRITDKQIQMVIGIYILIKVLVVKILSNPTGLGLIPEGGGGNQTLMKTNFKVLASLTYYVVMEFMEQLL